LNFRRGSTFACNLYKTKVNRCLTQLKEHKNRQNASSSEWHLSATLYESKNRKGLFRNWKIKHSRETAVYYLEELFQKGKVHDKHTFSSSESLPEELSLVAAAATFFVAVGFCACLNGDI
jgi:hypothetical protein